MDLLNLTLNRDTNHLRAHVKEGDMEVIIEEWGLGLAMLHIRGELTGEQTQHLYSAMAATRVALDEETKGLSLTDEPKPIDSAPSS